MAETKAPKDFFYTDRHEWVKIEKKQAIIGITDYAQSSLGDIVYIELPKIGFVIKQFGLLGTVESVKAAEDIASPLSGEVIEINQDLNDNPSLVNEKPFNSWIAKIKDYSQSELKNLLTSEQYIELVSKLD